MFNRFLSLAGAAALIALPAVGTRARAADELAQNLGPVGPHEPILTAVGGTRVIAFFVPGSNNCALHAVVWDNRDVDAESAIRVRANLEPGQIVHIDSAENELLNLRCGRNAATLEVLTTDELVAAGTTIKQWEHPIRARPSGH